MNNRSSDLLFLMFVSLLFLGSDVTLCNNRKPVVFSKPSTNNYIVTVNNSNVERYGLYGEKLSPAEQFPIFNAGYLSDSKVKRVSFVIKNKTLLPIKIKEIRSGCACIRIDKKFPQIVPSRQKIDIPAEIIPEGYSGNINKKLFMRFCFPNTPEKQTTKSENIIFIIPIAFIVTRNSAFSTRTTERSRLYKQKTVITQSGVQPQRSGTAGIKNSDNDIFGAERFVNNNNTRIAGGNISTDIKSSLKQRLSGYIRFIPVKNLPRLKLLKSDALLFSSPSCPECNYVKHDILPKIFSGYTIPPVKIIIADIDEPVNMQILMKLEQMFNSENHETPVLLIAGKLYHGVTEIKALLHNKDTIFCNGKLKSLLNKSQYIKFISPQPSE